MVINAMQNSNPRRMAIAATVLIVFPGIGIAPVAIAQAVCDSVLADVVDRVENAPYSAQRRVTTIHQDGSSNRDEATQTEARDGKGRTYHAGERHWTTLVGNERVQKSEILVRIVDPVSNTNTTWSSGSKEVKVVHWPQATDNTNSVEHPFNPFLDSLPDSEVQKLGTKTIEGVLAEGFRRSYTLRSAQNKCDNQNVAVEECWYSPELKIVVLETDNVPCTRSFTSQLENIVRGEPDVAKYHPPAGYARRDIEMKSPTQ